MTTSLGKAKSILEKLVLDRNTFYQKHTLCNVHRGKKFRSVWFRTPKLTIEYFVERSENSNFYQIKEFQRNDSHFAAYCFCFVYLKKKLKKFNSKDQYHICILEHKFNRKNKSRQQCEIHCRRQIHFKQVTTLQANPFEEATNRTDSGKKQKVENLSGKGIKVLVYKLRNSSHFELRKN